MPDDKQAGPKSRTDRQRVRYGRGFFELERTYNIDDKGNPKIQIKVLNHIPLEPTRITPAIEKPTEENPVDNELISISKANP